MADIKQDLLSLQYSSSFALEGIQEANIDLELPPAALSATVYGTVTDGTQPLADATYTAADGEFAFYDVADGVYTLRSTADGYQSGAGMTATVSGGSIVNVEMTMTVDSRTYNGTVSGVIRDNAGLAVAGCFVGLYQVVTEPGGTTKETLIAVTKTNATGSYLFGGVLGGQYMVKAKLER